MKRYYKVLIGYTTYVQIDESELEKALTAFQRGVGAIFSGGAVARIDGIIPDDVRMMGWNEGYRPTPEEQGEISRDRKCISARRLMADVKTQLSIGVSDPKKLSTGK